MAKPVSRTQRRQKSKERKMLHKEKMDAAGISRKRYRLVIGPRLFFVLKGAAILLIPLVYFIYSPLLAAVMVLFVALFFLAIGVEHGLNRSVIKANHIHLQKADSAVALLLLAIALFGAVSGAASGGVGRYANTFERKLVTALTGFGTLETGVRSVFGSATDFHFGAMDRPEGFIPDRDAFFDKVGTPPPGGFPGGRPDFAVSMDDVPIAFMFSQVFSTIATALVVAVGVLGAVSLFDAWRKMRRSGRDAALSVDDDAIASLSDEDVAKVVDFGERERFDA